MKLHLNLPNHLQLEISVIKDLHFNESNRVQTISITKIKQRIIKLYPHHWFNGVWEDLNFNM